MPAGGRCADFVDPIVEATPVEATPVGLTDSEGAVFLIADVSEAEVVLIADVVVVPG